MADDLGERTEEATPRRLREARADGKVASSRDLGSAIALLLGTLVIWFASGLLFSEGQTLVAESMSIDSFDHALHAETLWIALGRFATGTANVFVPLLVVIGVVAALSQFIQIGWLFTMKPLEPQVERLNPVAGFRRLFGIGGAVRVSLDMLKVVIVLTVAGFTMYQYGQQLLFLPYLGVTEVATIIGHGLVDLALRVGCILLLLGLLDLLYQKWKYRKDMRMTKQQVKDDLKDAEGDPEYKRRRMRMMQQVAMQRVAVTVPKADVIVTNPEHLSVAIQYDSSTMTAPIVVAKGADAIAMRIRQLATQHGIPIVERKPLARALYAQVEVNQPIPYELFKAVAELLAHVYRLDGRVAG